MKNPILLYGGLKWLVVKMSPIITQENSWCAKPYKYVLFKKLNFHLRIISRRADSFNPLKNVIDRHEDIKIIVKRRKWFHKVNSPNVERFYLKDPTLRDLMPLENVPSPLASITTHNESSDIFKESGPIETNLKDLNYSLVRSQMFIIS